MKLQSFLCIFFLSVVCSSCLTKNDYNKLPDKPRNILPPSTGNVSELVLIISDKLWAGEVGAIVRETFQENIRAIPQKEALFDLYNIEPKDFSNIFKTHKNILWLSIGDEEGLERKNQKWAKNQLYVRLSNETEGQLAQSMKNHAYKIRAWFLDKDQKRRLEKLKLNSEKEIQKQLQKAYEINTTIPKGYQVATAEQNFIWLRKDNPKMNVISNIWIYTEKYYSVEQFNKNHLIALRDSIGKVHIGGGRPNSFMATEMLYDPFHKLIKESPYTIQSKGLWTMKNDFLGGPYTAYAILDEEKQRMIYAEGFIYCPSERKRAHIFELEAILSGLKLN